MIFYCRSDIFRNTVKYTFLDVAQELDWIQLGWLLDLTQIIDLIVILVVME